MIFAVTYPRTRPSRRTQAGRGASPPPKQIITPELHRGATLGTCLGERGLGTGWYMIVQDALEQFYHGCSVCSSCISCH
ncbi:MAG: hypothetical protein COB69_02220 [Phycisphaera sp.]|nr:MAG: hypothetical protein COB69_02220 [Phycisphaera sp.]